MEKYVIKRSGNHELMDISKIRKQTQDAVKGLNNVSLEALERKTLRQLRHEMTTAEIQSSLIKTAVEFIDVDTPDWTFVAARLFLYDIYHRIAKQHGYHHLKDYITRAVNEHLIVPILGTKYDLELLNSYIVPERDLQFNYLGIKTAYDKYLIRDASNTPIELPQHMFMAIAMFLCLNETGTKDEIHNKVKEIYDILSKFEVMCATPTLSNARKFRHQLSSCYVGSVPDTIEGIFDTFKEMALYSKYGGGVGWDFGKIRSVGAEIAGTSGVAGGVIPFLKIANDICVAVDQLGVRKGAIAPYIPVWHKEVKDFCDLRKNSGEERRRAHELFPALWIDDVFMERLDKGENYSLFDPYDVPMLNETYGDEFKEWYLKYEQDPNIKKEITPSKELWKYILTDMFESGMPFLGFKDNANNRNPNKDTGIIRSSNLCTEIFQNTAPSRSIVRVNNSTGIDIYFEEYQDVTLLDGSTKKAKYLTSLDVLPKEYKIVDGKIVYETAVSLTNNNHIKINTVSRVTKDGETAVCNLASINLGKVNTKEDLDRVVPIAIRMLDNVIDLNFYPTDKVITTNLKNRAIGLGVMGESEYLATNQIEWGSAKHYEEIDRIFESISYNSINSSLELGKIRGEYPDFDKSEWKKGIVPIDTANENAKKLTNRELVYDWDGLREKLKKGKMRNGYLLAVAPTSSISILVGTTQCIEPCYKKRWLEGNISGTIAVTVPNLNLDTWNYYISAYDLDQTKLVEAAAVRQKWIDQGESLNIFMKLDKASGRVLSDIYRLAHKLGLKSTYYLRSESPDSEQLNTRPVDRSMECVGCQ